MTAFVNADAAIAIICFCGWACSEAFFFFFIMIVNYSTNQARLIYYSLFGYFFYLRIIRWKVDPQFSQ